MARVIAMPARSPSSPFPSVRGKAGARAIVVQAGGKSVQQLFWFEVFRFEVLSRGPVQLDSM